MLVVRVEALSRAAGSSQGMRIAEGHQRCGPRTLPYKEHFPQLEQLRLAGCTARLMEKQAARGACARCWEGFGMADAASAEGGMLLGTC